VPTIPNKRREILQFELEANGGADTQTIVIPGSEHYLAFSVTVGTLANITLSAAGLVHGSTEPGNGANGAAVTAQEIAVHGGSATATEVDLVINGKNQTYTWKLYSPLSGGISITAANGAANPLQFTLAIMMYKSVYSASL
jgi:hypothetical protein